MFYSQFILAKKGPLGTIWIAAHLERKLRKNQVADTDIGVSVDSILFPEVPIALRLSSHLLLGVVRIYSRKVNYLFDDCSEALLKIKQAFRSTAVDLPPEESTAPYHSITMPETFDLDDFELPDDEIFQGNYVDHHVSTREQITLQDTMEGVVYSTSQFGLDERFGDGDTSHIGLDFDEDVLGKVAAQGTDGISDSEPQMLGQFTTPLAKHGIYEGIPETSESTLMNGNGDPSEVLTGNTAFAIYAQAPSTPGLEEPNLAGFQEPMACNDHLDLEDHNLTNLAAVGSTGNSCSKSGPRSADDSTMVLLEVNDYRLVDMETKQAEAHEHDQIKPICPVSEFSNGTIDPLDGPNRVEDIHYGIVINNDPTMLVLDEKDAQGVEPAGVRLDGTVASPSCSQVTSELEDPARKICSSSSCARVSDDYLEDQQTSLKPELQNGVEHANNVGESCSHNTKSLSSVSHEEMSSAELPVLRACNSFPSHHDMLAPVDKPSEVPRNLPSEVVGPRSLENATSCDNQFENIDKSATSELSAPEKLLSVPEVVTSKPSDLLVESTPDRALMGGDSGETASIKLISGKKRTSTESAMTVHSLNSVESFGEVRGKRTAESIPDDDDLLSSILVGRKSSVLKMKPTPPASGMICTKRCRTGARGTASKRKVLMDDTMVLHGDTIRQQLTNTEDIRRVRKKAPCTRPEISMIQRQFLEDEIFTEPIFTGMSLELVFLHTETFDLSGTMVSKSDEDNASAELAKDVESSVGTHVTKEIEALVSTEPVVLRDDVETETGNPPIDTENQNAENHNQKSQEADAQELGILHIEGFHTSNDDPLGEIAEMEIDKENSEVVHPALGDTYNVSEVVQSDKADDEDALLEMDALCMLTFKKLDARPMEMDASVQKEVDAIEVVKHNVAIGFTDNEDATLATASLETGECKNVSISNDQPVKEIGNDEKHIVNETEVPHESLGFDDKDLAPVFSAAANLGYDDKEPNVVHGEGDEVAVLNGLGFWENNPPSGIHAEIVENHRNLGESEDGVFENDTEFLNVDDEIASDVEDMPSAEDTSLLENSGWSSRTRAVAKYLQTLLDKEAVHGKRVLAMNSLLDGKTRKEASRMFFETLVLKTRDYIHVEQAKAFDNVNIRPRVKLMKSEF